MDDRPEHGVSDLPLGPPSGYFIVLPPKSPETRIEVARGWSALLGSWKLLCAVMLVGLVFSEMIALNMRNLFRSQVLVAPVTQNSSSVAKALNGQIGGLASLVGIDLGGAGGGREESLATLSSRGLARDFIVTNSLLPILYADRWDSAAKAWHSGAEVPSLEEAVRKFTTDICNVAEDRRTGIITVQIDWYDRDLAARWANGYVALANEHLRKEATESAQRSIDYLNGEVQKTSVIEARQAMYRLIESQVNIAMAANVQTEFAFKVIDRAVASDPRRKISPHRAVMGIEGALAGALGAGIWVLWRRRREWLI